MVIIIIIILNSSLPWGIIYTVHINVTWLKTIPRYFAGNKKRGLTKQKELRSLNIQLIYFTSWIHKMPVKWNHLFPSCFWKFSFNVQTVNRVKTSIHTVYTLSYNWAFKKRKQNTKAIVLKLDFLKSGGQ